MTLELHSDISGQGKPLLILHGLFGSATNWRSVARHFAARHTVHALDLRNHGGSPWAATMTYPQMADDVRHYIERHQLQDVTLMGHSMGGKTAMTLALSHPELVARLIVVDIAPRVYAVTLASHVQAMRSIDLLAATSRGDVQRRLQALLPDAAVAAFLVQNLVQRDTCFDWRINLTAIAAAMPALVDFPAALRSRVYPAATTLIAGANSEYLPGGDTTPFAPMFPHLEATVIQNAGHWVHAEQPQRFIEAVERALRR